MLVLYVYVSVKLIVNVCLYMCIIMYYVLCTIYSMYLRLNLSTTPDVKL